MNYRVDLKRMCWKELRQLAPLVGLLLVMGLALHLLFLLGPSFGLNFRQALLLFGLPCLFAVGAAALLVGQERELRTLQWLSSLPIRPQDIIRIKLGISFVGLLVVWLGSGLLFLLARSLAGNQDSSAYPLERGTELLWPLHSVYLLLLGFATAWRVRSPLVSLLWIVPLACLPQLLSSLGSRQWGTQTSLLSWLQTNPAVELTAFWIITLSLASLLFGWRSAKLALAPTQAGHRFRFLAAIEHLTYRPQRSSHKPITTPLSALIWQFTCQNRLALSGVVALCLLAAGLLVSVGTIDHVLSGLAALQVTMATAWLGVLVFQSDQLQQRLSFLAVRGVSPESTWLTRQLVPCGILTAILFSCGGLIVCYQRMPWTGLPVGSVMLALLFSTFGIAQWVGQMVKSPIVAALLTPLVCVLIMGLSVTASALLATPLIILVLCSVIPFVATFSMMRPFMDGRTNLMYWLQHAAWLGLIVLLLVSSFLVETLRQPSLSRAVANQFREEAQHLSAYRVRPLELVMEDRKDPTTAMRLESPVSESTDTSSADAPQPTPTEPLISDQAQTVLATETQEYSPRISRAKWVRKIEEQLAQHSGPVQYSRAIIFLRSDLLLARFQLEQTTSDQDAAERYRQDVKLMLVIIQRMRLSPRLIEQEFADALEIELLHEALLPSAKTWLGDETYLAVAKWLGDNATRYSSRRRAILLTWNDLQSLKLTDTNNDLLVVPRGSPPWPQLAFRKRRASYMAGLLMEYLSASQPEQRQHLLEELANYWNVPSSCYVNPMASQTAASESEEPILELLGNMMIPGRHWHGAWESQAEELLKSLL